MNKVKKKIGGYNSGKICLISPDGHRKYINKLEVDKYILMGYSLKEQRGPHSELTKNNMKHSHKKMRDTSNMGLGNLKWIYIYNDIKYTGGKLQKYLNSIGYSISMAGIEGIINNSQRSCKKYPDLVGKILHYKDKATGKEYISMISDICLSNSRVRLGWSDSLENLFNDYELWNGEKWIPFGVLEK